MPNRTPAMPIDIRRGAERGQAKLAQQRPVADVNLPDFQADIKKFFAAAANPKKLLGDAKSLPVQKLLNPVLRDDKAGEKLDVEPAGAQRAHLEEMERKLNAEAKIFQDVLSTENTKWEAKLNATVRTALDSTPEGMITPLQQYRDEHIRALQQTIKAQADAKLQRLNSAESKAELAGGLGLDDEQVKALIAAEKKKLQELQNAAVANLRTAYDSAIAQQTQHNELAWQWASRYHLYNNAIAQNDLSEKEAKDCTHEIRMHGVPKLDKKIIKGPLGLIHIQENGLVTTTTRQQGYLESDSAYNKILEQQWDLQFAACKGAGAKTITLNCTYKSWLTGDTHVDKERLKAMAFRAVTRWGYKPEQIQGFDWNADPHFMAEIHTFFEQQSRLGPPAVITSLGTIHSTKEILAGIPAITPAEVNAVADEKSAKNLLDKFKASNENIAIIVTEMEKLAEQFPQGVTAEQKAELDALRNDLLTLAGQLDTNQASMSPFDAYVIQRAAAAPAGSEAQTRWNEYHNQYAAQLAKLVELRARAAAAGTSLNNIPVIAPPNPGGP
jgi:hypothetical protein